MTGSADNAQEIVTHRTVKEAFWKTLPTSNVYCLLKKQHKTCWRQQPGLRMVSDRIKSSIHTNKHTQPFSTVSSRGQSGPACRENECLTTLYYNLLPLMQSSSTERQAQTTLRYLSLSLFLFIYKQTKFQKGQFNDLEAKSLQDSPRSKVDPGTQCTVLYNGLMGHVVALHLAKKHQRIYWGRRVDYVRVETRLLTDLTVS